MTGSMTTNNGVDFKHLSQKKREKKITIPAYVSTLSCSRDRWMQDYLGDFRQRLDGRADALGGRERGRDMHVTKRK